MIVCHPDEHSFTMAIAKRTRTVLDDLGHDVRVRDLYREEFVPELSAAERRDHLVDGVPTEIAGYAEDLGWCDSLVLVYPTWWGGQPAMLKGWMDRVWAAGVAWELPPGANRLRPRLRHIDRIAAITTHGSSKLVNMAEGEGGKRTVTRSLRVLCSRRCRTRWWALYGVDRAGPERRERFMARLEARLARL